MASNYTTWVIVQSIFARASDAEPVAGSQTTLMERKTDLFRSWIRDKHKGDLITPYPEAVALAIANFVADELTRRKQTNRAQLEPQEFDHTRGLMTQFETEAHRIVAAIKTGEIVLAQDDHGKDVHWPAAVPGAGNTGVGHVDVLLPHEYDDYKPGEFLIDFTTEGRVDDGTARYQWYMNYDAENVTTDVKPTVDPAQLQNQLFVSFRDTAIASATFKTTDSFTIKVLPTLSEAIHRSPQQLDFYQG